MNSFCEKGEVKGQDRETSQSLGWDSSQVRHWIRAGLWRLIVVLRDNVSLTVLWCLSLGSVLSIHSDIEITYPFM